MKSSILLACALFLGSLTIKAQSDAPVIAFEFEKHDFGDLKEGNEATKDFVFTNTGKRNLILTDVVTSCSCTASSWPREPIAPGQKGTITVGYDTKGKSGSFNKSITITSNASEETKRIFIKGNVIGSGETSQKSEKSSSPLSDE